MTKSDTICALATPHGRGSVAIVRLSGPRALEIAQSITHRSLTARYAHFASFYAVDKSVIDQGIVIYFPNPYSYTGEHVVEFQFHGNPFVAQRLLQSLCKQGARLAIAGEFSERAFLNGKLDLSQLEAIADLISSGSEQAARSAVLSMQGMFSKQVQNILQQLIEVRTHIEAALDFAEEDIEVEVKTKMQVRLIELQNTITELFSIAQQGVQMQQGVSVVLTGKPNVGKSSLLNALCAEQRAIVTDMPGTTRDIVYVDLEINGVPMRLLDTAGLREKADVVEQAGIDRARNAMRQADLILHVIDSSVIQTEVPVDNEERSILVYNKIDLLPKQQELPSDVIPVSAITGEGLDVLRNELLTRLQANSDSTQTPFSARARHLDAIQRCQGAINIGLEHLRTDTPLELAAEELRVAQKCLAEITGDFTPDDLLDYVFREFCIGK